MQQPPLLSSAEAAEPAYKRSHSHFCFDDDDERHCDTAVSTLQTYAPWWSQDIGGFRKRRERNPKSNIFTDVKTVYSDPHERTEEEKIKERERLPGWRDRDPLTGPLEPSGPPGSEWAKYMKAHDRRIMQEDVNTMSEEKIDDSEFVDSDSEVSSDPDTWCQEVKLSLKVEDGGRVIRVMLSLDCEDTFGMLVDIDGVQSEPDEEPDDDDQVSDVVDEETETHTFQEHRGVEEGGDTSVAVVSGKRMRSYTGCDTPSCVQPVVRKNKRFCSKCLAENYKHRERERAYLARMGKKRDEVTVRHGNNQHSRTSRLPV